ncbi:MAG: hypothetical protein J6A38_00355 [Clostridia bacterium]|nr:hypothetical protein [Clostridia bacterium]
MKYTVQSTKYVLKNWIYLFPFAVIPALFLAFSTNEVSIVRVLKAVFYGKLSDLSFPDLFRAISILSFASWRSIVFGIIGVIVIVPCVALLMAILDKHFRIGKRTWNGVWGKLNDNFLSTFCYTVLLLAIYETWALLLSALLFFLSLISIKVVAYILMGLCFVGLHVLLLYAIGSIYLWLPCMQLTGFRAFEALHYSNQLVAPIKWGIVGGQFVGILFVECVLAIFACFVPTGIAFLVSATVLYAGLLLLYCVRMQIAYFDRDQIERVDQVRYYR